MHARALVLIKANVGNQVSQLEKVAVSAASERDLVVMDLEHEREKVTRLTAEFEKNAALMREDSIAHQAGAAEQVGEMSAALIRAS